ncbi:16S rRNA (guanine(966)-N(2))-methyltransferase RsmD [Salirhabdus salicampi]|uniref:16S rRNA (guanine(966)-N(2))-methyltransferase RsmD n=1 Tax=Salirhabdus salicampi TaxID=476102 RepID=UPI0020C2BC88|nr:16S rRNA (guanine(966)-N(2))-methyltransferase RsmD [Salirhabdus salicampi]MCP8616627.1 16S rRNA (guanine(966)-N(2))-methyltransferase RsmD [Salirhabdus salicampi]
MRVISGKYKGRRLKSLPGKNTRPTTDKVKEALFQIIGPYFNGGIGLDLFAGSGGLGIEVLSRGADRMIFVDKHPKAIQVIHENIKTLNLEEQTEVYRAEAFRALKAASKRGLIFDWIFLDPPYGKISFHELLAKIEEYHFLHEESIVICEHMIEETLPSKFGKLERFKQETYGSLISVSLYRHSN